MGAPPRVRVEVRVMVEDPGGDDAPRRIDRPLGGGAVRFADSNDLSVLHGDVGIECRLPRTVDNAPVFNEQIIRHLFSSHWPVGAQSSTRCVLPVGERTYRRPYFPIARG